MKKELSPNSHIKTFALDGKEWYLKHIQTVYPAMSLKSIEAEAQFILSNDGGYEVSINYWDKLGACADADSNAPVDRAKSYINAILKD